MDVIATLRYLLKRVLMMIPTMLAIILVVMLVMNYVPGGGLRSFSSRGEGDWLDSALEKLNLHDTLAGIYARYVYNICHGQFGTLRQTGRLMGNDLRMRVGNTLKISGAGIAFSLIFGIPLGFTAALYKGRAADNGISVVTLVLSSIPSYCVAVICSMIFVVWLHWLPLYGFSSPLHYVMPMLVTALPGMAIITAITRSAVLNVLGQQYVTVLRAGGVAQARILYVHVLRNAMVIVMSSFQNIAISILCSGMIAENFFTVPGLGSSLVSSVSSRSVYITLACIVLLSAMLMVVSLVCDVLCILVDPRMRQKLAGGARI